MCFARKAEFEAGNFAAKRRIATEIVNHLETKYQARYLKRNDGKWMIQSKEQAILKTSQVIRDYQRPDRILQRGGDGSSKKRHRSVTTTPMDDVEIPPPPTAPIVETPTGVQTWDVLCGRGAFVNGHEGNQKLRALALERKARFDAANYQEKRVLAEEIVEQIQSQLGGRFLKRPSTENSTTEPYPVVVPPSRDDAGWVQLNKVKSIHKACQVMRDMDRVDRRAREEKRRLKKLQKAQGNKAIDPGIVADAAALSPSQLPLEDSVMSKALELTSGFDDELKQQQSQQPTVGVSNI